MFSSARISWKYVVLLLGLAFPAVVRAEESNDRYLWLITLDGLRNQDLFWGAEKNLISEDVGGVQDEQETLRRYWDDDLEQRRLKLMPFFWQVLAKQGQIFGCLEKQCIARVTNGKFSSYPGYQEILCGYPDDAIDSNAKNYNSNVTVLEWLALKPELTGRVAVFASWDVFPFILNKRRSNLYVNAGWTEFEHTTSGTKKATLNKALHETPHFWPTVRFDFLTYSGAREYLRVKSPSVLYLALAETDDWCHSQRYDLYLDAAHRADQYLRELWEHAQSSEKYRNKTSMLITTDHGRGNGREGWKNHGEDLPGSELVWMAVIGPDTPPLGIRENLNVTLAQVAATAAALTGYQDYHSISKRIAPPLPEVTSLDRLEREARDRRDR